jgi:hypothetical protein
MRMEPASGARAAGGTMFQAILMGLIAILSFLSAGDWFVKHDIPAGFTFLGFGIATSA